MIRRVALVALLASSLALAGCSSTKTRGTTSQTATSTTTSRDGELPPGLKALRASLNKCYTPSTYAPDCAASDLKRTEALMDATFAELRRQIEADSEEGGDYADGSALAALDKSQTAWVTYRDAMCGYVNTSYTGGSASTNSLLVLGCKQLITEDRIRHLQETCFDPECTETWQPPTIG